MIFSYMTLVSSYILYSLINVSLNGDRETREEQARRRRLNGDRREMELCSEDNLWRVGQKSW